MPWNRAISFRHEAIRICKLLGAEFMNTYQDGCTHYVQMSNASTAGGGSGVGGNEKDWKRVRSDAAEGKVAIVSPAWLTACLEKGRRVGEGEYPWTVDVNKGFWGTFVEGGEVVHRNPAVDAARARSISGSDSSGSRVSNDKLSKVPSPQKTLIGHKRTVQETSIHVEQKRKSEIEDADDALVSAVNKLISTSHKLTKKSSWPKSRTGSTVQRVPSNLEDPSTSILLAPGKNSSSSTSLLPSDIMQEHDEDSFTQAPPAHYSPVLQDPYASIVTYDDPLARAEKRRLLEQLQGPTPTTSNPGGDPSSKRLKTSDAKNGRTTAQQPFFEPSTNPRSYTRVFQITGTHVKLRAAMKEKIVRLGGKVVDSDVEWNPECTHLICAKPVNTDKCYSVIAKGGWMLKEEYIEKSFQEGRFLEEEDFEWAVEVGIANEKIACCAKKWRLQLGNFRRGFCSPLSGAYQDWIVLYVTKIKSREAGFVKVLRSGLADVTVVLLDEVDSALDLQSFTHCFTDVPSPDTEPRFSTIQKCGISVASVFYICEYLMK
ncbi:hypothetical protein BDR26DRAFT_552873 [Obelidium mucronatum]|nr:hypothetical protein BDR26DRAFT_552873 [Obelidium mucronatum]